MSSRDAILNIVKLNQPEATPLPDIDVFKKDATGAADKFVEVLTGIGGKVFRINSLDEIGPIVKDQLKIQGRIINTLKDLKLEGQDDAEITDPHGLHDVQLALIKGTLGVAENGAIWVKDEDMGPRPLPFICENLAVVVNAADIVPAMYEAYGVISGIEYNYASFIAGPSKTADIEQSLVIGAHGPRSMSAFLLG